MLTLTFTVSQRQGWEGSRYSLGRAWIEAIFWLGICVGEPIFWYLVLKRHFLHILKVLYVCLKSLDTVLVSESPTHFLYLDQPWHLDASYSHFSFIDLFTFEKCLQWLKLPKRPHKRANRTHMSVEAPWSRTCIRPAPRWPSCRE